eukprot:12187631-Ditylum_brightwellii.AAC.1
MQTRLAPLVKALDHESQRGFYPGQGTGNATFTLKMAPKKHQEHNLKSWVPFINFVKAFDRVPWELLWKTLERFGAPPKFICLLIALCKIIVKPDINRATAKTHSNIGVMYGGILGPILFIIYMATLNISQKKKESRTMCLLCSKPDNIMTDCCYNTIRGVEEFELSESAYADGVAFLFSSYAVTE